MNFQFCLAGTPIEPHEAVALLEVAGHKGHSAPVIEISTLIDTRNLNASKLFELAVSKQNQDLASLAWKISLQQKQPSSFTTPKLKVVSSAKEPALEEIIEQLNRTNSYCALGTAMLLKAASSDEWVTLRETATQFACEIVNRKLGFATSKFLRGFDMVDGKPNPIDLSSGIERKYTFHVSPMYIALREGLVYCKKHGLVEQKKMLSMGAPYSKNSSPQIESTRRIYYKIKTSDRGRQLVEMWADMDRYIEKNLELQAAS